MCGFAGVLLWDDGARVEREQLRRMGDSMAHRGPDGAGEWSDGRVGLTHRRLSIIGLDTGAQPLATGDERVWVSFNGEIYNFHELRSDLQARGHRFKTEADTEVLVYLWLEYGRAMVERLTGMFAFALWDRREQALLLARDRVGIKPLYYAVTDRGVVFGSEIKALLASGEVERQVNRRAIDRFLCFDYMPGAATMLHGVRKLPPAHTLVFDASTAREAQPHGVAPLRYWDLPSVVPGAQPSLTDAAEELEELFDRVVEDHLLADVPVGVLVSGGLDSTAVLSSVSRVAGSVDTFTVGFDDPSVTDERPFARIAASEYGSRHHEISVDPREFWSFLPRYVWHMEEPVCEPPAIALFTLAKLAAEHVKVVLSGEGGDEAFAGYQTYPQQLALESARRRLGALRRPMGRFLPGLASLAGARGRRLARALARLDHDVETDYWSRTSHPGRWFPSNAANLYTPGLAADVDRDWSVGPARRAMARTRGAPGLSRLLYTDTVTWLPDDLLVKADKMTMASSLELRVPLLDHRILEFAARLPASLKLGGGTTKRVLRQVFEQRVPASILRRPKAGFPVPYGRWLRNELAPSVRELLLDPVSVSRDYFRRGEMERLLASHASGAPLDKEVFNLVVLELWHRAFIDGAALPAPDTNPAPARA